MNAAEENQFSARSRWAGAGIKDKGAEMGSAIQAGTLGTDVMSVLGDLEQEKPQQAKRASGSSRRLQQRGRLVLCPAVS